MHPRQHWILASLLVPGNRAQAERPPQEYDYSYQLYQEDDDRVRVEAHYLRGSVDLNDETTFRFQLLNDSISGASPTGALPGTPQPYLSNVDDVRSGILGALARQFGDHRVELEVSHSSENDYISRGISLADVWELNQKNTTISSGFNYLNDSVLDTFGNYQPKDSYDIFTGISQVIDQKSIISANLTLGYAEGYLNDRYKVVQRTDIEEIPDGLGGFIKVPVVNIYPENRPDSRFRQVLQFKGTHYFETPGAALEATLRFGHDDFGIGSQTLEIEWRQEVGRRLMVTPFVRYYRQNEADFFVNTLDGVVSGTPPSNPSGSKPNYSADYRLSSFDAFAGGLRLNYQFNDYISAAASYERYVMQGTGGSSEHSPGFAYPSANLWTFGLGASF